MEEQEKTYNAMEYVTECHKRGLQTWLTGDGIIIEDDKGRRELRGYWKHWYKLDMARKEIQEMLIIYDKPKIKIKSLWEKIFR